jgi:hypothetical protein
MSKPLAVYVPTVVDSFESFRLRLKALNGKLDKATLGEMHKVLDEVYREHQVMISKEDYEKAKQDPLFLIDLMEDITKTYHKIAGELLKANARK